MKKKNNFHFRAADLQQKLSQYHLILLDSCGEYSLYYACCPMYPQKRQYVFCGPSPDNPFETTKHTETSIYNMLEYINKTYPKMKPGDWELLRTLQKKAKEATTYAQYRHNKETIEAEEKAIQELIAFQKEHGLIK